MKPKFDTGIDYFAVLGVHFNAPEDAVKLAYRRMARRYHPDVSTIHDASQRFIKIAHAYEVLTKYRQTYCRQFEHLQQLKKNAASNHSSRQFKATQTTAKHKQTKKQTSSSAESAAATEKTPSYAYSRMHKPIHGKDRHVTYPLTLRYAIRLLKMGFFYIPGLKVQMKFTREAFAEKTFRLKGRGYKGLFGGKPGNFFVSFVIQVDRMRYRLEGGDIYTTVSLPATLFTTQKNIELESITGRVSFLIPEDYSAEKFIQIKHKGLPKDEKTPAGDLYLRLTKC